MQEQAPYYPEEEEKIPNGLNISDSEDLKYSEEMHDIDSIFPVYIKPRAQTKLTYEEFQRCQNSGLSLEQTRNLSREDLAHGFVDQQHN